MTRIYISINHVFMCVVCLLVYVCVCEREANLSISNYWIFCVSSLPGLIKMMMRGRCMEEV